MDWKRQFKDKLPKPIQKIARNVIINQILNLRFCIWKSRLKEEPILRKPVFMIGCSRSGTTISAELFGKHPWVARLDGSIADKILYPDQYKDADAGHHLTAAHVTEERTKLVHAYYEFYRQLKRKKRLLIKFTKNSVRIDYLRKMFPDAIFIHIIRDGRAVTNSIVQSIYTDPKRQKIPFGNFCKPLNWRLLLRDDLIEQSALQWREIVKYIVDKRNELGVSYYEIKYEELCINPQKTMSTAFDSIGMPSGEEILALIPKKLKNMNYKYKEMMTRQQIETINRIQNKLLEELGYPI